MFFCGNVDCFYKDINIIFVIDEMLIEIMFKLFMWIIEMVN